MIKKFKEFNESTGSPLSGIISKEEIEDQFLRIEEVLDRRVRIKYSDRVTGDLYYPNAFLNDYDPSRGYYNGCVRLENDDENAHKVEIEMQQIKHRLENMFHVDVYLDFSYKIAPWICIKLKNKA